MAAGSSTCRNKALDAKSFFATVKPDDNQHEYGGDARRPDPQEPDVLLRGLRRIPRPPPDGVRADVDSDAGRAQRRFQRAAGHDLRSANDHGPIPTAPASCAIRFQATSSRRIGSRPSRDTSSRSCPIQPTPALQNNYLGGSLPIGFNNENVTGKVDLKLSARAAAVGAVLARQAQPGDAVPRAGPIRRRPCRCRTPRRGSSKRLRRAPRSSTHTFWDRSG